MICFVCMSLLQAFIMSVCVCAKSLQPCLTLSNPMDCSPPGSSVHGILQVRILEWVVMSSSIGFSQPRDRTWSLMSPLADRFFITRATRVIACTNVILFPFPCNFAYYTPLTFFCCLFLCKFNFS